MADLGKRVALRKESVDRNISISRHSTMHRTSLSARRAWIEIRVALALAAPTAMSLSARRAWIEIYDGADIALEGNKSLSARRAWIEMLLQAY